VALVTLAMHGESRLSKIEQRMDDSDKQAAQMERALERIEQAVWQKNP
jgi:hypothetical protein